MTGKKQHANQARSPIFGQVEMIEIIPKEAPRPPESPKSSSGSSPRSSKIIISPRLSNETAVGPTALKHPWYIVSMAMLVPVVQWLVMRFWRYKKILLVSLSLRLFFDVSWKTQLSMAIIIFTMFMFLLLGSQEKMMYVTEISVDQNTKIKECQDNPVGYRSPAEYGIEHYEEHMVPVEEGVVVHLLILLSKQDNINAHQTGQADHTDASARSTTRTKEHMTVILECHGNAGNLGLRLPSLVAAHKHLKSTVAIFDYRGYGSSTGVPSEEGFIKDLHAVHIFLSNRFKHFQVKFVLFGKSVGGSLVVQYATRLPCIYGKCMHANGNCMHANKINQDLNNRILNHSEMQKHKKYLASIYRQDFPDDDSDEDHEWLHISGEMDGWQSSLSGHGPIETEASAALAVGQSETNLKGKLQLLPISGVISENTFTSIPDLAKDLFPVVAWILKFRVIDRLIRIRWETATWLSQFPKSTPVLFLSSTNDEIAPHNHRLKLIELSNIYNLKYKLESFDAQHNDAWISGPKYWLVIKQWLAKV